MIELRKSKSSTEQPSCWVHCDSCGVFRCLSHGYNSLTMSRLIQMECLKYIHWTMAPRHLCLLCQSGLTLAQITEGRLILNRIQENATYLNDSEEYKTWESSIGFDRFTNQQKSALKILLTKNRGMYPKHN